MPNAEPHRLPATTLVRLIESGELTAEAVVQSCLERITQREPVVRAWSHLAAEAALARARELDQRRQKTLLNGVPFGIKDIFDSADMPTTYGSPIYVGWRPANDASAAALPRAAGGILLGKTVTTEFANRQPGPTTNPHNPDFSPGGSSSGSAAAVADFMVPLAIGTQTGGSVIPAGRLLRRRRVQAELWLVPACWHADQYRGPRHGRHHGALGRRHCAVSRSDDGHPLRTAGDAGKRAAAWSVSRAPLG